MENLRLSGRAQIGKIGFWAIIVVAALIGCLPGGGGGGGGDDSGSVPAPACGMTSDEVVLTLAATGAIPSECVALLPPREDTFYEAPEAPEAPDSTGSSGSSGPSGPSGSTGRLFVLGTAVEPATGNLQIYVHGTKSDGSPLVLADLRQAILTVGGSNNYTVNDPEVTLEQVSSGDKLMSLAFVTDYSSSMSDADLDKIGEVYASILNDLPEVYEAEVVNFSRNVKLRRDWTEGYTDLSALLAAVQRDDSINRTSTALYDAIGRALERDVSVLGGPFTEGDGLIERCRAIHLLVVHTDGKENASVTYSKAQLLALLESSRTVPVMLGSLLADTQELKDFAGQRGAFVYAYNAGGIGQVVKNWSDSLQNLAKFTLTPDTLFNKGVVITLGTQTVSVERASDGLCEGL